MSGWINPDTMTNDYLSYVVVPSRQGHKIQARTTDENNVLILEVIAWQVQTDNKTGDVQVNPITVFGIHYPDQIKKWIQPATKKTRADFAQ
jgi:hypothetical protein